jgi:hypothetical protein
MWEPSWMGLYCLNHYYTILLVAPQEVPRILGNSKDLANNTINNVIRTHPCAHPQHKGCETHYIFSIDVEAILDGI